MSGCTASGSTDVMRRAAFVIACVILVCAGSPAQWVLNGPPVGGSVVSLTADSQYVYIGTTQGRVWRRPLADFTTGVEVQEPRRHQAEGLSLASFPNPCNASTVFTVTLPAAGEARLALYDMLGRSVMPILNRRLEAGSHRFPAELGSLPSGTYVVVLNVGDLRLADRLVLVR